MGRKIGVDVQDLIICLEFSITRDSSRGSCHLKEGEQSLRAKNFWQWKVFFFFFFLLKPDPSRNGANCGVVWWWG